MADSSMPSPVTASAAATALPAWAREAITQYESGSTNQFILYGNVYDRMVLPLAAKQELDSLTGFLLKIMLARFDVVLSYDLGNGIRIEKGGELFSQWPYLKQSAELPKAPRPAVETLTHYFRYNANLARLKRGNFQVGCLVQAAHLVAPNLAGGWNYDLNALALLLKDWASDTLLTDHALATFLVTENLNDLHPLLVNNPRAGRIKIPLPTKDELRGSMETLSTSYKTALKGFTGNLETPAQQLTGATLSSIESLLKIKEHKAETLTPEDLAKLKKELVEKDCSGLIEFMEPKKTLEDLHGQEKIKNWLRQDIALWRKNDLLAMPMGYLLCGPVGTGKTFMVECLAGEAKVPVVKLKNFRDRWVGSSEGNLEKIFRLLSALGQCMVFVDEADQALGKREGGSGDSGVSGRLYSMLAEEMSNTSNRGKIVWILASSRPDLIEVDLKRPGRVDVKIPLFPTITPDESYRLIRALTKRRGLALAEALTPELEKKMPLMLTPGAAEALSVKVYRQVKTKDQAPELALADCLADYQNPVSKEIMDFQIQLAVREASDLDFVPQMLRAKYSS